jgi:hypothetical protein
MNKRRSRSCRRDSLLGIDRGEAFVRIGGPKARVTLGMTPTYFGF